MGAIFVAPFISSMHAPFSRHIYLVDVIVIYTDVISLSGILNIDI